MNVQVCDNCQMQRYLIKLSVIANKGSTYAALCRPCFGAMTVLLSSIHVSVPKYSHVERGEVIANA